jgi:hypothetical protein
MCITSAEGETLSQTDVAARYRRITACCKMSKCTDARMEQTLRNGVLLDIQVYQQHLSNGKRRWDRLERVHSKYAMCKTNAGPCATHHAAASYSV